MKVKELIEILQEKDPEQIVVVPGYEGGYNDVAAVDSVKLKLDVNSSWYYGKHDDVSDEPDVAFDCWAVKLWGSNDI